MQKPMPSECTHPNGADFLSVWFAWQFLSAAPIERSTKRYAPVIRAISRFRCMQKPHFACAACEITAAWSRQIIKQAFNVDQSSLCRANVPTLPQDPTCAWRL
jgi:hypothetical protein